MKTLHLLIVVTLISFCAVSTFPSYSLCLGTFEPKIQKDNGTDAEGYRTYQVSLSENQTYPIKYKISSGAVIEAISSETPSPILNIIVREVPQGGNLTIQLPTKLLGLYSAGGYSVAEGTMCAMIAGATFPTPIESNSNFTTVSLPLMNYDGVRELIIINGNHAIPEFLLAEQNNVLSPYRQMANGILPENIVCHDGMIMIVKLATNSPVCIKSDSVSRLVDRNWGINPLDGNGPKGSIQQYLDNLSLPYAIKVSNSNHTINYAIHDGTITEITNDAKSKSIIVSLQSTGNGNLTIDIPRVLNDSTTSSGQDDALIILIDGQEAKFRQIKATATDRILIISFNQGARTIEIIGTSPI